MKPLKYIKNIFVGLYRLFQGMYITMLNFFRPKITEQYPENRATKVNFERFRATLTMPVNDNNEHRCTACGICAMNCPNKTITVVSAKVLDENTGKDKKVLDRYTYDIGSCIFCSLCTYSCPQDAIEWSNDFEHAGFRREKLIKQLKPEGSTLAVKNKE